MTIELTNPIKDIIKDIVFIQDAKDIIFVKSAAFSETDEVFKNNLMYILYRNNAGPLLNAFRVGYRGWLEVPVEQTDVKELRFLMNNLPVAWVDFFNALVTLPEAVRGLDKSKLQKTRVESQYAFEESGLYNLIDVPRDDNFKTKHHVATATMHVARRANEVRELVHYIAEFHKSIVTGE